MYKVVRHGENSLQYKILAQEEEGLPTVKRRSSTRTATFKVIAIITLLIIGIIASAFLVPLLLANDFIAVTGTFQKFSVSTLRRSHSGNHVVVIAKKPYGWNPPHPTSPPRNTPHNASQPPPDLTSPSLTTHHVPLTPRLSTTPPSTTTTLTTTTTTTTTTSTTPATTVPTEKHTQPPTTGSERNWGYMRFSPTIIRQEQSFPKEDKVMSSQPVWVGSSRMEEESRFLYTVAGLLVGVVILVTILCKTLLRGRVTVEKETAQSKEDKTKLLKPSSHDEE